MKKWQIAVVVVLCIVALYQWYNVRLLQEELADQGRIRAVCQQMMPPRQELAAAANWLHDYYQSQDGLQRPQGLWLNDRPDFEGVAAWILDVYLWARVEGVSDEEARQRIVQAIQGSEEWKTKHPSGAPR